MSLYGNRIWHRDRYETFERCAIDELEAVRAGRPSDHVAAYYLRRGAVHGAAWRALVLADADRQGQGGAGASVSRAGSL